MSVEMDQASELRAQAKTTVRIPSRLRCIAVSSGKGGVGKTMISVGIGWCLASMKHKVLILDADLGLANVDIQMGLNPKLTLQDAVFGRCSLDDVVIRSESGPDVLVSASGAPELVDMGGARREMFIEELIRFAASYEYLIIDVAAGIGRNIMSFLSASPEVLVVVANEPISAWDGAWLDWAQIQKLHQDCWWSKFRCRFGGKVEVQPAVVTTKRVIQWLVEWSERHPGKQVERYKDALFGLEAIEAYGRDLADMSLTVEKDFDWGNNACHAITPQWTTRRHIGAHLEQRAALFSEPARARILQAAAGYRAADAAWTVFDEHLGQRYVHVFGGKQGEGWADPERRGRGSDAVDQALEHERTALTALRQAIAEL